MSYTPKEEQTIRNYEPVTYMIAQDLAKQFGKPLRSIISKAVALKVYKKAEKPESKPRQIRKIEIRKGIEASYSVKEDYLNGLENATRVALDRLFQLIP